MTNSNTKIATVALWAVALAAALAFAWFQFISPRLQEKVGVELGAGDYHLTATDGTPFTEANLKGKASAVFFGFAHCPEVCPTTLGDIAGWQDELGDQAKDLQVYFVTIDPERDTAELLGEYVGWVPGTLGVTGSREEIDKAIRSFRIFARKVPLEDGEYTMDHSALVMLFDRKGRFFEPIGYQEDFDRAVEKIQRLLEI